MVQRVVREKGVVVLRDLGRIGPRFMEREVYREVSRTAVEETRKQILLNNSPSRIRVNRKRSIEVTPRIESALTKVRQAERVFDEARNIRIFFTDASVLADAVQYAYDSLKRKVPRWRGYAWKSVYFWLDDPDTPSRSRKEESPVRVRNWILDSASRRVNVRILGPLVEYRRFVIYGRGGSRQTARWANVQRGLSPGPAIDRYRFTERFKALSPEKKGRLTNRIGIRVSGRGRRRKFQVRVARAIGQKVRDEVRRQYRDISCGYGFTRSRDPLPIIDSRWRPSGQNIHIPEISLGIKKR